MHSLFTLAQILLISAEKIQLSPICKLDIQRVIHTNKAGIRDSTLLWREYLLHRTEDPIVLGRRCLCP